MGLLAPVRYRCALTSGGVPIRTLPPRTTPEVITVNEATRQIEIVEVACLLENGAGSRLTSAPSHFAQFAGGRSHDAT